jgi:VWFA-related protein
LFLAAGLLLSWSVAMLSQEPTPVPPEIEENDVLQINTKLLQTGVFVTNKKGEFVDNLKQEDFEVRVDGKPVSTLFFERVIADKKQFTTENQSNPETAKTQSSTVSKDGRVMIFLVDDSHLSFESHKRTRDLILNFIENEMLGNDSIAIVSSSNKIGFLQQFTGNKDVLRAAAKRIVSNRNTSGKDETYPPMSEYEALSIDRLDRDVTNLFVGLLASKYGLDRKTAEMKIQTRAKSVLAYARIITQNTVSTLEETIKKAGSFPGRKAVFFISDGFLADSGNTDLSYYFNKIADAAVRSNTVIYSFDAKGLDAALPEGISAETNASGIGFSIKAGERFETQDGLSYLANNTGGKFIHNTNDLKSNLTKATEEVFTYYLLAWQPEDEISKSDKLKRITISVKGKPELKVRANSGYLAEKNAQSVRQSKKVREVKLTEEQKLIAVTNLLNPTQKIPLRLSADYVDFPNEGGVFSANLQIDSNALKFIQEGEETIANLEMVCLIYDSSGKQVKAFKNSLKVSAPVSKLNKTDYPKFNYDFQTKRNPGLYQMRVAVRDMQSRYVGNTSEWLEIPDLSSRKLTLSSLLLGEKKNIAAGQKHTDFTNNDPIKLQTNIDHCFENSSSLRFLGFIYNSAYGQGKAVSPNITIQAKILKQNSVLITFPGQLTNHKEKDMARLPFTGEIFLNKLPPGHYELKVFVTDQIAKNTAIKSVPFEVK